MRAGWGAFPFGLFAARLRPNRAPRALRKPFGEKTMKFARRSFLALALAASLSPAAADPGADFY